MTDNKSTTKTRFSMNNLIRHGGKGMRKTKRFITLFALVMFALSATISTEVRAQAAAVDPAATEILKRMTDYLGSVKQFSVHTQNTIEDVLNSGHRVDFEVSANVIISRPNKLRAERKGEMVDQVFYYDGKTVTLYNSSDKVYAKASVSDTFEGMFKFMYESLGFGMPISDLVYPDAFPLLMQDVTFATVIGKSYINGVKCDHVLYSRPGVDFPEWVSDGNRPLPHKYVVTDTAIAGLMGFVTIMSDWNVEPAIENVQFTFVPPKGAQEIIFLAF
jgi:hypothetical protein